MRDALTLEMNCSPNAYYIIGLQTLIQIVNSRGNSLQLEEFNDYQGYVVVNECDPITPTYTKKNLNVRLLLEEYEADDGIGCLIRGDSDLYKDIYTSCQFLHAVYKNNLDNVRNLLQQGANINVQGLRGTTAIQFATRNNKTELLKILLQHRRVDLILENSESPSPYIIAIQEDDVKSLKLLLDYSVTAGNMPVDYFELLMNAVFYNSYQCVDYLIEQGTNINQLDQYGTTPLAIAVKNNNNVIAHLLLSHGADDKAISFIYGEGFLTHRELAQHMQYDSIIELLNDYDQQKSLEKIIDPDAHESTGIHF